MSDELKPCPFCMSKAKFSETEDRGMYITCSHCMASTRLFYACGDDPRHALIEAWNTRAKTED